MSCGEKTALIKPELLTATERGGKSTEMFTRGVFKGALGDLPPSHQIIHLLNQGFKLKIIYLAFSFKNSILI